MALSLSTPQRGHLIARRVYSASANFLLHRQHLISSTATSLRVALTPLCAQHGAQANRRTLCRRWLLPVFPHQE